MSSPVTGRRRQTVIVNDLMQRGYRSKPIAPLGRNFHPEHFALKLTPQGNAGAWSVLRKIHDGYADEEFPAPWLAAGRALRRTPGTASLNYFGVRA